MTSSQSPSLPPATALVTGGSRGLGSALTEVLVRRGWRVIVNGRTAADLRRTQDQVGGPGSVVAVQGDVGHDSHRRALAAEGLAAGRLDLLVNNASTLGPLPLQRLADYATADMEDIFATNTFAPLALTTSVLSLLEKSSGRVINLSSDAAVEAYPGWGGYGASKAALDHLTAVLAAEHAWLRWYAFDPGDMATDLQQQAFPDEDISDRADPRTVVPALLRLLDEDLPSGRYRAADLLDTAALSAASA